MRKSFTLLFSTLMLLCVFGFSSLAQAPVLATTDPLTPVGENVKPTTTDLVVKFDQNVRFTSAGGTLTVWKGDNPIKTIALVSGSANASIKDNTLTVKHGVNLTDGTAYAVSITNGIENSAGDKFAGIAKGDWTFTTGDYTAPVVKTLVPADNATNVDVKASDFALQITFDDVNNITAVDGKKVWMYRADGTVVDLLSIGSGNTSVSEKTATITISSDAFREELTQYYVNIEKGAFTDANGNEFAGIMDNTSWTFSSTDYSAPYITESSVSNISYTSATLNAAANEAGSIWYVAKASSAAAPAYPGDYAKVATGENNAISVSLTGLTSGTEYTVYLVAENTEGDDQAEASTVKFTTLDNTAPLASGNTQIVENNVTVGLELTFNEEVEAGSGNLVVKRAGTNETVRTVAADDLLFEEDEETGNWVMTARFEGLTGDLSEKDYYVVVPTGYVTDVAGNNYVSTFTTTSNWTFTSSDHTAPVLEVSVDEGTAPAATDDIVIEFSEGVRLIDGVSMAGLTTNAHWFPYISLEKGIEVVPFTASYADGTISISPVAGLVPNATYVVKIRANAFEDMSGNKFSNVHTTYEVTTGDFSDAFITYDPEDGDVKVAQGTVPVITFSKAVYVDGDAATAAELAELVTLTDADGDVEFTVEWDAEELTLTVVPAEALASEGVYTLAFDYTKVEDVNGQAFDDPGTADFTMIDYIVPTIEFSHTGTVTDKVGTDDLTITFSEDVTLVADAKDLVIFKQDGPDGVNLEFTATLDGKVITVTPATALADGKVYYYGVGEGVASDGVNDTEAAFSSFTFSPEDVVPGGLQVAADGYVPAIGAENVKVTSGNLVASLTFTEAVKANPTMPTNHDAKLYLKDVADAVATVPVTAAMFEGSKLTLTFPVTLVSEGEYYITLDKDVAVAVTSNTKTFAGIPADKWTFTAADLVKPVLTAVTPAEDATDVKLDTDVVIGVDEAVVAGTGNIKIAAAGADDINIAVADADINNADGTITVSPAGLTHYNTVYTVTVPEGAFTDEAGNKSDKLEWSFTTEANVAAEFVLDPKNGADMVEAGTNEFTITFSDDVVKGENGKRAYLYEVVKDAADKQLGYVYVEQSGVVLADNVATLNFGVSLEAGKDYYILADAGMFKDDVLPESEVKLFAGLVAGQWAFATYDKTAPTFEVSYDKLGDGMDINSDITITFNKPVDYNDEVITNVKITDLFNLSVGGTSIAFTGTINEDKTVVVLPNNSFVPALTEANSGQTVSVAPKSGFKGINNNLPVATTAETFKIADYSIPVVTVTAGTADGDSFTFTVSSTKPGTLYWAVQEGTAAMTAEEVMEGTAIVDYTSGTKTVTVDAEVESETTYTIYAVATDANGNVSEVKTASVTTGDITKPVLVEKTSTFTTGGVLTLTFSENVVAGGAEAIIREAGSLKYVETVALTAGSNATELKLTAVEALKASDDKEFIIEIAGGKVADAAGNTWDGQIGLGENAWVVGLPDRTAPTLVSIEPELPYGEGVTKAIVELDTDFVLTFSEDIKLANDAQLLFYHYDTELKANVVYEVLEAASITVNGNILTLNPSRDFVAGERYQLTVTANSILDLADHFFVGSIVRSFDGISVDVTAPVATFSPADGATGVSENITTLTISFDEDIVMLDGSVVDYFDLETLVYVTDGSEDLAHTAVINNANEIVITLDGSVKLELGASYTYGFEAAFMDAAGNEVGAGEATFTVRTQEVVEAIITFEPDNETADPTLIPVDQVFTIIFNGELYTYNTEASQNNVVVTGTYMEDVISLTDNLGAEVSFTAKVESRNADETVVSVTPENDLGSTTTYVLTVKDDMVQIGVGLDPLKGEFNTYITEDVKAPEALTFVPTKDGAASASATMSVSFDEDVEAGTGTMEIRTAHGELVLTVEAADVTVEGNLVKITTLSELEGGQEYFVLIPEGFVTDLSGNAWEGITEEDEWRFTIDEEPAAPVVVNISPVGRNVLVDSKLKITFDRPVQLGTEGFVALYDGDGVAIELVRFSDTGMFSFSENNTVVTVNIAALKENTRYEAEVAKGTFATEGSAALVNEAVTRTIWTFTTEINDTPEVLVLTPADNASGVSLNAVASMEFDIDVQPGTGNITLRRSTDGSVVHSFDVTGEEVAFEGNVVSFSLAGLLEGNATDYYIIVPNGAITNISNNPEAFAGLEQMSSWNFTTVVDGYATMAIADVQGTEAVSPVEGEMVRVTGTVTAVVPGEGFFMQDANAAWSGIWVATTEELDIAVGDGAVAEGTVDEVDEVTTIVADAVEIVDATLEVEPVEVASPSVVADEMYESVLVFVGGATAGEIDENGQFAIFYESADMAVVNNWLYAYDSDSIVAGHFFDITGVVNGALGAYTIEPRMEEDIVDITKTTPAIVIPGEVVDFRVYPNPFSNYIRIDNADKLTRVVITNIAGQRVMDVQFPGSELSVDNLVNGVYVINLFNKDGMVKSDRIVKR